jgi:23S rRNA-/tRNA-specific pseudouridylate synthase
VGDDKYGDFDLNRRLQKQGLKRMFLHAWRLVQPPGQRRAHRAARRAPKSWRICGLKAP